MSQPSRGILPALLLTLLVGTIVGWFATVILATPLAPPRDVVDRLTAGAVADLSVSYRLTPRIRLEGAQERWLIGLGTVTASYPEAAPVAYEDVGGTLSFTLPTARITAVEAQVVRLEGADGQEIPLPADATALTAQVESALRQEAVVGGLLRQADVLLLRQIRGRVAPLGVRVEAMPPLEP